MQRDWRKIIASDDREFAYGEIFKIKDDLIYFPEALFAKRTYHGSRLVVITQHCRSNSNPNVWTVNVAPLSTKIEYKRDTDLEINPEEGNYIDKTSLIRLGLSQPVLKVDLEGPVGRLTREQLLALTALQIKLSGIEHKSFLPGSITVVDKQ